MAAILTLLVAAPGWGSKGGDAAVAALTQAVEKQAARIKALEKEIARQSSGSCLADTDPEPELRPFRAAEQQKKAQTKQNDLNTLFSVTVGEPLTAVAISSGLLDKNVPKLVVAGGASGTLHLFDKNGTLALSQPPDEASSTPSAITALAIGPKEDPFVAVGTRGGDVLLYNLTLPRPAVGKRKASGETSLVLAMRAEAELDASGKPAAVLTLNTYMRGRKAMLAVGDATGAVRLLFRNGTQRASISAGGAVHAMERGGSNNAYLAVGAVGLTQLLYAASSDGVISIYNSKQRSRQMVGEFKNQSKMVTGCKLVTTVRGHEVAPLGLTPVKGYLYSASPSLLVSHNVSGLYARTRDDPNVLLGRPLAGSPSVLAGTRAGHLVVGAGAAGELTLIESKQKFKTAEEDSASLGGILGGNNSGGGAANLMRNPVLLGVVMVLVFWQSSKFFGKGESGGGGGGGLPPGFGGLGGGGRGGRGGGFEDFDMDSFRALQKATAKGGNGNGGDFSRFEELDK